MLTIRSLTARATRLLAPLALLALALPAFAAEKGHRPCSLLTPTELETALGTKLGEPKETDAPYEKGIAHDHDGVLSSCSWTGESRSVFLAVSTAAVTPEGRARGLKAKTDAEAALKKQGLKVQKKVWGPLACTLLTPPKGKAIPHGTTCGGDKGKFVYYLSVSTKADLPPVPMERLRGLAGKVADRLK